jgi:hypothetical protein
MDAPVLTKERALSLVEGHKDQIKALGVKRLGLFGSFTRGEQQGGSDIDFLVEFEPGKKTFDNFIQLSWHRFSTYPDRFTLLLALMESRPTCDFCLNAKIPADRGSTKPPRIPGTSGGYPKHLS